ncbi:MAG: primosomal protein N' [Vicinamibacterales bacterium]
MLVSVAVPVPFLGELTYLVPDGMQVPPIGGRVRVPIGSRVMTGCVVAHGVAPTDGPVKAIERVLDHEPLLPFEVVELCRWTAEYYMAGLGDTLRMAMPPGARRERPSFKMARTAVLTAHGLSLVAAEAGSGGAPGGERLTGRQKEALEALSAPGGLPVAGLRERGLTLDVVTRLVRKGLVVMTESAQNRDPFEGHPRGEVADVDRVLTEEQAQGLRVIRALSAERRFAVVLLHGVTGSGKTEVYLRLVADVIGGGGRALLMVPEIALTPSMTTVFRRTFGERVAIQHSALSDGERHDQWHRIRRGDVDVVIGTRSAVFAPLDELRLIIVDEEHDSSYKQEETPRYNGRDVAIVRGRSAGALVVLGSATPSMESYQNAVTGKYTLVALQRRVLDRPMAAVRLVDMRQEYAKVGPDVVVSTALEEAIEGRLAAREQVVVLLNRRGFATSVFCRQCGDAFECPNCSVSLTMHTVRGGEQGKGRPRGEGEKPAGPPPLSGWGRCHYCNFSMRMPNACRKCAAPYLEQAGFGTERVEAHLRDRFPDARIGRVDRDSVRRKGALAGLLNQFAGGELDILVGTQMIAKGHDFPRVTLVGVISADVGLGLADFRAGERTFQLLTQVAGRAGRGEQPGEAIVQTLYPEHYSVQLACAQDFPAFFAREVEYRRGMRYPPFVALINGVVRGPTFDQAMAGATALVRELSGRVQPSHITCLGPAPAPLGRLRGEHRVQFFVKGTRRAEMRQALRAALESLPDLRRRVMIDVDPLSVL